MSNRPYLLLTLILLCSGCVADYTAGKSKLCAVHHVVMEPKTVPIVYGMPRSSEFEEMAAQKDKFPYGRSYVLGGCMKGKHQKAKVFHCPECEKVRERWLKAKGYEKTNAP